MSDIRSRYDHLLATGELRADVDQAKAVDLLADLAFRMENVPKSGSLLWRFTGRKAEPVRGLYMWGGVGRGKSMLMDLFYDCVSVERKRRVHFHEFMLEVHERLKVERTKERGDPIPPVVEGIATDARLLCFDEMVINNMADAAIMSRLFTGLIVDAGVTIVTTSNRPPVDLYKDGLNRQLFLPFIDLIRGKLDVLCLNGPTDYRMERLAGMATWYVPNGKASTERVREAFFRLTDFPPEDSKNVPSAELAILGGRTMHVPKSLKGVAVFSFKRLCAEARGAPDYLSIARHYHTVIIVGIPILGPEKRNEAARFKVLIDELYEHKVKLIATADAEPMGLYPDGDGAFEFERTVSRLMEMQSADYLAEGHGAG